MKPLLVGEANPYGKDPRYALFPHPKSSAGYRLARLILAMPSRQAYLDRFDRVNLCPQKWSVPVARASARLIVEDKGRDKIVLLGAKVARAFGLEYLPFSRASEDLQSPLRFIVLPHPSGLCRLWNEPTAFERARQVLVEGGVL